MRNKNCCFLFAFLLGCTLFPEQEKPLNSALASGKITFKEVSVISEASLPGTIFLENPVSLSVNAYGDLYVCDANAGNIKAFDANGTFLRIVGKKGQGPGDFNMPSIVLVTNSRLIVWERINTRLSLLDLSGKYIKSLRFSQVKEGYPVKLRALPSGEIVVETERLDEQNKTHPQECVIALYSADLEFIKVLYSRSLFRSKRIYDPGVADVLQPFNPRVFWDITPAGKVAIGFSDKYAIELYDPVKGNTLTFTHEYSPVLATKDDQESYFSLLTVSVMSADGRRSTKRGAADYIVRNTTFPKYKPAFDDIRVDSQGNYWVHSFRIDRDKEHGCFDAFTETGKFIGKVEISPPAEYPRAGTTILGRTFWIIETDKDDSIRIVKYKIG